MYYMISITHRMQKHKFGIMCLSTLFIETILALPKLEKQCIDVSHPRCTRLYYVTDRYHWIQKYKFSIMCPSGRFVESILVPTQARKIVY
jgi:hypothetical protein